MISRRTLMLAAGALASGRTHAQVRFPEVTPRALVFPRDHGAHPDYRTEWWYLTGWLDGATTPIGFQITFFRTRTTIDPANPSAFAAKQLVIAHAAIADPARGTLLHDERIARTGFGAASASTEDTDVSLDRWRFARSPQGAYRGTIAARGFTLELDAQPTQPLLLQGEAGYSRKGPLATQASYYYSQPQLAVRASITWSGKGGDGKREERTGVGWLDHEWSSTVLADDAAGWDWLGMNLDDGSALTAFVIRPRATNGPAVYAYASLRSRGGATRTFGPRDVRFSTRAEWASPRTRATWPVSREVRIGELEFTTQPLMDDQELDSRSSTGAVYWEGASRLLENGMPVGRGYLEMTGYLSPIRL